MAMRCCGGLRPVNRFHPKTILLEAAKGAFRPVAIAVGSANLTCSGLCFGHEHTLLAGLDHLDGVPAGIAAGLESLHTMLESTPTIDEDFATAMQRSALLGRRFQRRTDGRNTSSKIGQRLRPWKLLHWRGQAASGSKWIT